LFGGEKGEKKAVDVLKSLTQAAVDAQKGQNAQNVNATSEAAPVAAPSGLSWGPNMPVEENQYNFSGSFEQYFDSIFLTLYPQYRVAKEVVTRGRTVVYTFFSGEQTALVVEILSRKSGAEKRRNDCRANGIPYLRFYHDYHGWWNVKQYVVQRTNKALGL